MAKIIGWTTYRNFELRNTQDGNAKRWHIFDRFGMKLSGLGYRSKAAAKRAIDRFYNGTLN